MSYARPMMPGLTYIAGIHIKPLNPLPADVQVSFKLYALNFNSTRYIF